VTNSAATPSGERSYHRKTLLPLVCLQHRSLFQQLSTCNASPNNPQRVKPTAISCSVGGLRSIDDELRLRLVVCGPDVLHGLEHSCLLSGLAPRVRVIAGYCNCYSRGTQESIAFYYDRSWTSCEVNRPPADKEVGL
jgi:hypothetical protein